MLGVPQPVDWHQEADAGIVINLPTALQDEASRPCRHAVTFKIEAEK